MQQCAVPEAVLSLVEMSTSLENRKVSRKVFDLGISLPELKSLDFTGTLSCFPFEKFQFRVIQLKLLN